MNAFARSEAHRASGALLAGALLALGGCATEPSRERSPTATMLAEKLARVGAPASSAAGASGSPVRLGAAGQVRGTHADTPATRSRPRPLDPVPPLYRPPPRDLPLQPILVEKRTAPPVDFSPRPSPLHRDPLADDPLRRIDPVSGLDPLGRLDPSGGVDFGPGTR